MARKAESARFLGVDPLDGEQLLLEALFGPNVGPNVADAEAAVSPGLTVVVAATAAAATPRAVAEVSPEAQRPADTRPEPVSEPSDRAERPEHYKVVSISLYREDIELLDRYVHELKRRGHYKANKSHIIRQALAQLDLDRVVNPR